METTSARSVNFDQGRATIRALLVYTSWAVMVAVSAYLAWIGWARPVSVDTVTPLVALHISACVILAYAFPELLSAPTLLRWVSILVVGAILICVDFFGVHQGVERLEAYFYHEEIDTRDRAEVAYATATARAGALQTQLAALDRQATFAFEIMDDFVDRQRDLSNQLATAQATAASFKRDAEGSVGWSEHVATVAAFAFSLANLLVLYAMFGHPKDRPIVVRDGGHAVKPLLAAPEATQEAHDGPAEGIARPEIASQISERLNAEDPKERGRMQQAIRRVANARAGGAARAAALSPERRSEIASQAAAARWGQNS